MEYKATEYKQIEITNHNPSIGRTRAFWIEPFELCTIVKGHSPNTREK